MAFNKKLHDLADRLARTGSEVKTRLKSAKASITAHGRIDEDKLVAKVEEVAGRAANYGRRAIRYGVEQVREGITAANESVRNQFPTREELEGRYAGIGSQRSGILLRTQYESCITFRDSAREAIPEDNPIKSVLLEDITASASANGAQLIKYLNRQEPSHSREDKIRTSLDYFK